MIVAALAGLALGCILVAALLTAAEAAFTYLPRQEAEQLLRDGRSRALRAVLQAPASHMHALRFWRVWFEMAGAVAIALFFFHILGNIWIAGLLATVTMAAVGFVLVGVSPRHFGRMHGSGVVLFTAPAVRILCALLGPVPGWLVRLGSLVAPNAPRADAAFFSEEEFRELVERATESDMIEDAEAELIQSVFDLGDTIVRAVMVPRTDMVTIQSGSTLAQAMSLFLRSGYSRIPVIMDSADQVRGILYLKDVTARLYSGRAGRGDLVDEVCREARYVPESKPVGSLLQELQRESTHVAIVIDEYGGTAGLVTLEDLIEEIVGEIVDEYDSERPAIEALDGGRYRISAKAGINDVGELFGLDLDDEEVDTVGGLLAKSLGRVPIVGSEVDLDGLHLRAERMEGRRNRISHIIAWLEPAPQDEDSHAAGNGKAPRADADQGGVREESETEHRR
ncbi:hemolysin family protein [Arthrobacter mobilis]|uniref:HlyC/CorC family transporter n=1 Tax=Arthrobacter mobilis TaxID=2724944 RepID=A0A7X6K385_9MICC|nr:hemolysin family protein [Arthrobacter mobilis]NKX54022.1 HlyC/CorC family transporter [Arthrobacter mobilis]